MATVTGGDKIADKLRAFTDRLTNAQSVNVGFLENSTYPDGTSVPMVAAIQEYGAPKVGIPARPFFRNAIAKHKNEWPKAIADLLKANDYDALRTLQLTGEAVAGQIKQSIVDTNSPPLAESTLRRRGVDPGMKYNPKDISTFGAKPLIDTGVMFASVEYEVKA